MAEMVKAKLNGVHEIILPKHRADRPEWYTDKGWEKARLLSMRFELKNSGKPEVMFYIGAEEGEMAALCQMWGADIVMFEPNDRVWPNIKAIWEANKLEKPLMCFSGFASNKDSYGALNMYGFPPSANGEVIGDHGFKELADPGDIQQIKIDTLVELTGFVPTALTLDVEGSEWEVLKGAENVLKKYKPKIWLSGHPEFMYHHFKQHLGDLRGWLRNMGYEEELLDYQHEVHLFYK